MGDQAVHARTGLSSKSPHLTFTLSRPTCSATMSTNSASGGLGGSSCAGADDCAGVASPRRGEARVFARACLSSSSCRHMGAARRVPKEPLAPRTLLAADVLHAAAREPVASVHWRGLNASPPAADASRSTSRDS